MTQIFNGCDKTIRRWEEAYVVDKHEMTWHFSCWVEESK